MKINEELPEDQGDEETADQGLDSLPLEIPGQPDEADLISEEEAQEMGFEEPGPDSGEFELLVEALQDDEEKLLERIETLKGELAMTHRELSNLHRYMADKKIESARGGKGLISGGPRVKSARVDHDKVITWVTQILEKHEPEARRSGMKLLDIYDDLSNWAASDPEVQLPGRGKPNNLYMHLAPNYGGVRWAKPPVIRARGRYFLPQWLDAAKAEIRREEEN
jgi:hypothetical protein